MTDFGINYSKEKYEQFFHEIAKHPAPERDIPSLLAQAQAFGLTHITADNIGYVIQLIRSPAPLEPQPLTPKASLLRDMFLTFLATYPLASPYSLQLAAKISEGGESLLDNFIPSHLLTFLKKTLDMAGLSNLIPPLSYLIGPPAFFILGARKIVDQLIPQRKGLEGALIKAARDLSIVATPVAMNACLPDEYQPQALMRYYQKVVEDYPALQLAPAALVFLYQHRQGLAEAGKAFIHQVQRFSPALRK